MKLLLLASVLLVTALPLWAAEDTGGPKGLSQIDTARPVISDIVSLSASARASFVGVVAAKTEIDLGFPVHGTVAARPVDAGDIVNSGDLIAQLDPEDFDADVRAAEAGVAVAVANLRSATDAQNRAKQLAGRGVDAATRLEDTNRALTAAQARHDQARASLASAREIRSYATLRAPRDGVITQVRAEAGATLAAGEVIVTLAGTRGREVVIDLSEQDVANFDIGALFTAELVAIPGTTAKAALTRIDPVAERSTRTRRLHLSLDQTAAASFRLGALAMVTPDAQTDGVLSLPRTAIVTPETAPHIWVVDRSTNTVHARAVVLGEDFGGRIRIAQGLNVGDEVVLKGIHSLKDGQNVGPQVTLP